MTLIQKIKPVFVLSAMTALGCCGDVAPVRIAYNYCTLSYTFAYYSDDEWVKEIDRLHSAGYNVALVTDGTFKVWQMTLRDLGYSDEEILAFMPDECARAWWLMDNLAGEGGPLDQATINEDGERGRFICAKMREKGIEPILQGYFGMMPIGHKTAIPQGKWSCYERPPMLAPTSEEFAEVAKVWYRNLEAVYGFKPKYLSGDLFHEGGIIEGIDVTAATRAVQAAQQKAFPGVTWVVQAWQSNPIPAVRAGLDPRFTLIEALVKDMSAFAADDSVCGLDFGELPWVWCEVLNFGGNHGLYGNLKTFSRLGRAAKGIGSKTFRGYGSLSEGFFTNPICYALFEEMMMRPVGSEMTDAELETWIENWVARRYGVRDKRLVQAWKILAETVYACPRSQEGTVENVMCAAPSWTADNVSSWGPKGGLYYDAQKVRKAALLLKEVPEAHDDYAEVLRQCLADYARSLVPRLSVDASERRNFLQAIDTEAQLLMTLPQYRLSTYEAQARRRVGERGAAAFRRMVTTWADRRYGTTTLADYANREYAELLRDYYKPRWKSFFESAGE